MAEKHQNLPAFDSIKFLIAKSTKTTWNRKMKLSQMRPEMLICRPVFSLQRGF